MAVGTASSRVCCSAVEMASSQAWTHRRDPACFHGSADCDGDSALCGASVRGGSDGGDTQALDDSARAGGTNGSGTMGVPDRIEDQRRNIHARVDVHGRRRRLRFGIFLGRRRGLFGVLSHLRSSRCGRRPIDDFLGPGLRPSAIVEHPLLAVPVPARRDEDHVFDLVDPLAALPFELFARPNPMTGEPVVRRLREHLRGRLELFEILGRLRVGRPFVGPVHRWRFGRRRVIWGRRHVLRNLFGRPNVIPL